MANLSYLMFCFWVVFNLASEICRAQETQKLSSLPPPPAIFVFGDSHSDTGNLIAAFPFLFDAENSPYGDTFFHATTGRFSDGRLIVDFMASAWSFPLVQPYFSNIIPNFRHGINFAVAGATARNVTEPVPFFLPLQTDQFVRFKRNVIASLKSNQNSGLLASHVPTIKSFEQGLYMISIGVNDIVLSLINDAQPPSSVGKNIVAQVIEAIAKAVQDLHKEGAMNFTVFNIPAIGCTPLMLTLASLGPYNSTDTLGCLKDYNELVLFFNQELEKALSYLNMQLNDCNTIMVADIYGFVLEANAHPSKYGFDEAVKLKACCGYGGDPYNYSPLISCGKDPAAKPCSDPSKYISWDGSHLTDAFNGKFVEEIMKETSPFLKPLKLHRPN